jgi:6-pyruvoyltetrahydropterin/6-carboxytetrahydropterin synthase
MAKYILYTTASLNAARALRDYQGICANTHGHNFKLTAEIETIEPDEKGLVLDFYDIKASMEQITKPYDHHFLNELSPFDHINPTNENLAKFFFNKLSNAINSDSAKVVAFSVWESEEAGAKYCV